MAEDLSIPFKRLPLSSGYDIPQVGYGLYLVSPTEARHLSTEAIQNGYRHLDSAAFYRNEQLAAEAIIASSVPRSDLFFTSKIPHGSNDYAKAKEQIARTLKLTGLNYIDLMLLHAPYGSSAGRKGAWRALAEAVEAGQIRSIGVSNYGVHHLDELKTHIAELEQEFGHGKGGVLSVGQWEIHPWLPRRDIVDWCRKHNVVVEAYSPLVKGQRWGDKALASLAKKHDKTEAQILLRWSIQNGFVPLPKSATPARIKENIDLAGFELSTDDMDALKTNEYSPVCWDPTVSALSDSVRKPIPIAVCRF